MNIIRTGVVLIVTSVLFILSLNAQQASTDTSWKVKARIRCETSLPQYPKTLTVALDGSGITKLYRKR
ncbi:MAG TPA: hypothetical protein VM888_12330 [Chitinophagaceae bacterium]|nr:hypothetical protein [Chitinophagaceae bacterium]